MSNNYRNEGFGMQKIDDELLRVSAKSAEVFAKSLGVFAQKVDLSAKLVEN